MSQMSLATFLAGGGDPTEISEGCVSNVVVYRRGFAGRLEPWITHALEYAAWAERLADTLSGEDREHHLRRARDNRWEAEALADPVVADALEAALPPEVLADLLVFAEECRHPHRLLVIDELGEQDQCGACGDDLVPPVIVVDDCGYAFCHECIAAAAEAIRR